MSKQNLTIKSYDFPWQQNDQSRIVSSPWWTKSLNMFTLLQKVQKTLENIKNKHDKVVWNINTHTYEVVLHFT